MVVSSFIRAGWTAHHYVHAFVSDMQPPATTVTSNTETGVWTDKRHDPFLPALPVPSIVTFYTDRRQRARSFGAGGCNPRHRDGDP